MLWHKSELLAPCNGSAALVWHFAAENVSASEIADRIQDVAGEDIVRVGNDVSGLADDPVERGILFESWSRFDVVMLGSGQTFHAIERVDSGAQGPVFKGTSEDGEIVAIKLGTWGRPAQLKKVLEVTRTIHSQPGCEYVARCLGEGRVVGHDDLPAIIFEWHDGMHLAGICSLLRTQQSSSPDDKALMPEGRALKISINVLKGLQALHADGWSHGDVAPHNVMIGMDMEPDSVRLIDFGHVLRLSRSKTIDEDLRGVGYMLMGLLVGEVSQGAESFENAVNLKRPLRELIRRGIDRGAADAFCSAAEMCRAMEQYLTSDDPNRFTHNFNRNPANL